VIKPSKENSLMSKTYKLLIVTALVVVVGVGVAISATHKNPPVPTTPTSVDTSPSADELWLYTNNERAAHGLPPLVMDPRLTAAATDKCIDMVKEHYWAHVSPTGVTPQDIIGLVTEEPINHYYSGENLSIRYNTSKDVIEAWIASPGHEANIIKPQYKYVGFAICTNDKSEIMVVQDFLSDPQ
jgi:uncharacterized protein YkwD